MIKKSFSKCFSMMALATEDTRKLVKQRSMQASLLIVGTVSKPIWEVFEGFESSSSIYDLRGVISTEEGIWLFVHFFGCNTKTNYSMIDDTVVFKRPKVVKLLLGLIFVW